MARPDHKTYIGGSDSATLMGGGYKTPLDLFHQKIGKKEPEDLSDNLAVSLGSYLEPFVLNEAVKILGQPIISSGFKRHVKFPFIGGHVDGLIAWEPPAIVETKTGLSRNYKLGLPPYIEWQVRHYMMLFDSPICYVIALLLDQRKFIRFDIERDLEIEGQMIETYCEFWERVQEARPPEPTSSTDEQYLTLGGMEQATDEEIGLCNDLTEIKKQLAEINSRKEETEEKLKLSLMNRGADSLTLARDGEALVRWSEQQRTTLDTKGLKKAHPEICDEFQITKRSRILKLY